MIPFGYGLYAISQQDPDDPSYLTRLIDKYTEKHDRLTEINTLHTSMMEQAGSDRVLFMNSKPQPFVDMKFPEYVGLPFGVNSEIGRFGLRERGLLGTGS